MYFLNFSEFPRIPNRAHLAPQRCHRNWWGNSPELSKPQPFVDVFHLLHILLPIEWEVQNRIPSGTILKALISGGENGPWMKFMRGEMTREDFFPEFGRLCSEIVSDKHT